MFERTEQEIMQNWKGDITKPDVSICCITYNHEKFIEDALNSFLMQETDFPFEIIVRDDASTDKTAKIIKKYHEKYPNIIKPIFEKENTYSKGVQPFPCTFKQSSGKYLALCEGDDYWLSSTKLQLQYKSLEKNSQCSLSCHDTKIVTEEKNYLRKHSFGRNNQHWVTGIYDAKDFISSSLTIPHTSSLFLRKDKMDFLLYEKVAAYDYHIIVSALINGQGYYYVDMMSAYRQNSGSLSYSDNRLNKQLINFISNLHFKLIGYLKGKYRKEILNNLKGHYIMQYHFLMNYYFDNRQYIKSMYYMTKLLYLCDKYSFYNKKDILWLVKNKLMCKVRK